MEYRKRRAEQAPININGAVVERVESSKFLGVHITNELSWSKHTKTVVKKALQNLFPLRRLNRFGMGPQILKRMYSCTIESMVASLPGMATARHLTKALQRVVRTPQYITGAKLPAIWDLYNRWCQMKAHKFVRLQSPTL